MGRDVVSAKLDVGTSKNRFEKGHPKTSREQWLQFINADSETCELSRLREKALHDEASALKQATNEGITIGERRGIAIGKKSTGSND